MTANLRLSRRYKVHSNEIQVAVHPGLELYPIKDISMGGVAIQYNPLVDESFESETIDIIAIDYERFSLPKIACRAVYDISALMEEQSFRGGERRVRGLEFLELTNEQEEKLSILLKRCFSNNAQ